LLPFKLPLKQKIKKTKNTQGGCFMAETKKVKVIECEVYSRVVGYFRPTRFWNVGKQQEFKERKTVNLSSLFRFKKGNQDK
jgi:anaerobic ribonucleoside-triphosphate reductase